MTESQTMDARYRLRQPGEAVPEGYELCADPNWVVSIRGRPIMPPEENYSVDYLHRPSDTEADSHTTDAALNKIAEDIRDISWPGYSVGWNAAIEACMSLTETTWPEADDLIDRMREMKRRLP